MAEAVEPSVSSATVSSVIERNQRKSRYAFEINITWSNGGKSTCTRSYQEFFEVHCKLLDAFPEESGAVKNSSRTIPYLPGKKIFRRNTKSLALERLPLLDQYIKDLMQLPTHISASAMLLTFLGEESIQSPPLTADNNNTTQGPAENETEAGTISAEAVHISSNAVVYNKPDPPTNDDDDNIDNGESAGSNAVPSTIEQQTQVEYHEEEEEQHDPPEQPVLEEETKQEAELDHEDEEPEEGQHQRTTEEEEDMHSATSEGEQDCGMQPELRDSGSVENSSAEEGSVGTASGTAGDDHEKHSQSLDGTTSEDMETANQPLTTQPTPEEGTVESSDQQDEEN